MFSKTLALSTLAATVATKVSYGGQSVVRCHATNREQLDFVHNLEDHNDMNLDFWQEARNVNFPIDIMVKEEHRDNLESMLKAVGVECDTMMDDVQAVLNKEKALHMNRKDVSYFESYHDWESVQSYVEGLATAHPELATTSTIGTTYEGKPMKIITMSTDPSANKPALWFDGGLHAREWVTVSTVTYLADTILNGYGSDDNATYLLDTYDIIICPVLNVDGYDYTWTSDRMWRKTRSPNDQSPCDGTDPNRNWNDHWGEAGTSTQKCSDSYEGAFAASEIEVQNIQNYLYDHKDTLKGYINFHSYSQLWMSNWGYTDELPPDYEAQNGLSEVAVAAIKSSHGKTYEYGPIATTIYPASGSSADYTYDVCGIKYSYGVELRDTGEFGFLLPAEEIIPTGEEIYAAVIAMAQYIEKNP